MEILPRESYDVGEGAKSSQCKEVDVIERVIQVWEVESLPFWIVVNLKLKVWHNFILFHIPQECNLWDILSIEKDSLVWKIEIRKDVILNKELGNLVIKGILL